MPMWRMPVTSPNAPPSIASTSARIRCAARGGEVDRLGRAAAALGDMLGRPALARIDDLAGEQRLARRGEARGRRPARRTRRSAPHRDGSSTSRNRCRRPRSSAGSAGRARPRTARRGAAPDAFRSLASACPPWPAPHNRRPRKSHPRLTARRAARKKHRANALHPSHRAKSAPPAEAREAMAACFASCSSWPCSPGRSAASSSRRSASRRARCCRRCYIGDYLFVAKWPYGYSRYSFPFGFPPFDGPHPRRTCPSAATSSCSARPAATRDFVKRVIGLPGDTIEVRGGMLILNGEPVPRAARRRRSPMPVSANSPCKVVPPATPIVTSVDGRSASASIPAYRETLPGGPSYTVLDQVDNPRADDFPAIKVPAGHVFLMGDNRDDSLDSRFRRAEGGIGIVPGRKSGRPRADHLLVDRRQRVLCQALDLVHRAARRAGSATAIRRSANERRRRLRRATSSATSRATSPCSSAR